MGSLSLVKLFRATEMELHKKRSCFDKDCDRFFSDQAGHPEEAMELSSKLQDRVGEVCGSLLQCVGPQTLKRL